MLNLESSNRFKKDLKKYTHNAVVKVTFDSVLKFLLKKEKLPEKYQDHALYGDYLGCRECHLKPDVLLIYWTDHETLYLVRIGSHSELF